MFFPVVRSTATLLVAVGRGCHTRGFHGTLPSIDGSDPRDGER